MAAIDLPFNDIYLSHLHESRIASKALLKDQLAQVTQRANKYQYNENEEGIFGTNITPFQMSSNKSSSDQKSSTDGKGQTISVSDSAVLSQYPPSLIRFLVLLSPSINVTVRLVHLITWTGGTGTASHSFILVLGWWAICLYGYEILRYCPQLALLTLLSITGVARIVGINQGRPAKSTVHRSASIISSDSLNKTIENIAIIADFLSTLYTSFVQPIRDLFSWYDPSSTFGLAVFLISSWPAWLLLFSGTLAQVWDLLGLSFVTQTVYSNTSHVFSYVRPHIQVRIDSLTSTAQVKLPTLFTRIDQASALYLQVKAYTDRYVVPHLNTLLQGLAHHVPNSLQQASGPRIGVFPILSLRVRHLFLVIGTIALTWCSPWMALIRHALWRSAFVRRTARFTWSILSGQIFFGHGSQTPFQFGGRLSIGPNGEPIPLTDAALKQANLASSEKAAVRTNGETNSKSAENVKRHEDVVYQFTIFENQRWWMGLDWTAALLPQERPSWADESNAPVSPPSSFSLPQPKTTLKHTPTPKNSNSYTKRVTRWQWIDPEWTVAGRDASPTANVSVNGSTKNRRASVTSAASGMSGTTEEVQNHSSDLITDPSWLDVDPEGWQYGDNGWEKMSKKSGLGRYTRRRRWIRRAVLVELVETDYHPTPDELSNMEIGGGKNQSFWSSNEKEEEDVKGGAIVNEVGGGEKEPAAKSPTKVTHENIRDRLAKAAANGSSVGTAQNTQATQLPTSPESAPNPTASII